MAEPTELDPKAPPPGSVEEAAMGSAEVRSLAAIGTVVVAARGVAIRSIGLAGNIVLARLLLPRDLGLVAFGTSLLMFATFLADGGLGASLIRRKEPPRPEELRSVVGFQLVVTGVLAALTAAAATPFGEAGIITAVMVASLPLTAFRTPGFIYFERRLSYRPLVAVELAESVAFFGWAITTVAFGWGVWGLATAAIFRAITGTAVMSALSPYHLMRPRLALGPMKGLLSFGLKYQAVSLVNVLRDEGLNVGTAAFGGLSVLGLWNLARNVLQVPFLVFESLWRVSFPAMSRLLQTDDEPGPVIRRSIRLVSVATGIVLAGLVGSAHALVPAVFGARWEPAWAAIPPAALGLMISGPISVGAGGYLYAIGDASVVLRGAILHTIAWIALSFALLQFVGVGALGIGWLGAGIVEAVVLGRAVVRRIPMRLSGLLALPTVAAAAGGAVGWGLARALEGILSGATGAPLSQTAGGLVAGAAAGLLAVAVFLGIHLLFDRQSIFDTFNLALRTLRRSLKPQQTQPAGPSA